jgi:hypothetical protein
MSRRTLTAVSPSVAIIATPRSGSTWLYELLASYLSSRDPHLNCLGEYFNVSLLLNTVFSDFDATGRLIRERSFAGHDPRGMLRTYQRRRGAIAYVLVPLRDNPPILRRLQEATTSAAVGRVLAAESRRRLDWLVTNPAASYLFKVFADSFKYNRALLEYVNQRHCTVVCLERRDRRKQILSGCVSAYTGVWNVNDSSARPSPREGPYECRRAVVTYLLEQLRAYDRLKGRLRSPHTVYYEDMLRERPVGRTLGRLGLPDWRRHLKRYRPTVVKLNAHEDYWRYFSNAAAIERWIEEADS